jgi:hypothetical protein
MTKAAALGDDSAQVGPPCFAVTKRMHTYGRQGSQLIGVPQALTVPDIDSPGHQLRLGADIGIARAPQPIAFACCRHLEHLTRPVRVIGWCPHIDRFGSSSAMADGLSFSRSIALPATEASVADLPARGNRSGQPKPQAATDVDHGLTNPRS